MNEDVALTLDDAVMEVLSILTGMDLEYDPRQDRYRTIVRTLNRALRANALEHEWSYYSSDENVGRAVVGHQQVPLRRSRRMRKIGDDAVRLVDGVGAVKTYAYVIPRDALPKYRHIPGLWVTQVRNELRFSRPFAPSEDGLDILVPVMREPQLFRMPEAGEEVPADVREQTVDFDFPDIIVARAAYMYAASDPVMQPRAQTLEGQWKNYMYTLVERDTAHTDSAYMNEVLLPISGSIDGPVAHSGHPHARGADWMS